MLGLVLSKRVFGGSTAESGSREHHGTITVWCVWSPSPKSATHAILTAGYAAARAAAGYATARLTSASGKSFVFDARADGFIRGEGCGTTLLREASPGASVLMVGSAIRQDGRSASLTAPNGRAQQLLV